MMQGSSLHLPIIMLTAQTQEGVMDVGFEVGADDHLSKPCEDLT